jgi:hypothetical protein
MKKLLIIMFIVAIIFTLFISCNQNHQDRDAIEKVIKDIFFITTHRTLIKL